MSTDTEIPSNRYVDNKESPTAYVIDVGCICYKGQS
jgi:hypothetical protein